MTTLTFKENIKIDNKNAISVYDFLDVLVEKGFLPKLEKLDENEVTLEIKEAFLASKKSKNRVNI